MRKKDIKKGIICRNIGRFNVDRSITRIYMPKAGDAAVFRVKKLGKHNSIQAITENNCYIFPGDHIMGVFGNRYATKQFEGYVPEEYHREYHILGKGATIGVLASMHEKFEDIGPTTLRLMGYVTDETGAVVNTKYLDRVPVSFNTHRPRNYDVVLSLGSNMDSGKTTSAAYLCRGIKMAKKKSAYIKLTGTVYTHDRHYAMDCGADVSVDFSTCGFPSTYMCGLDEILNLYETLLLQVEESNPDVVVVEIADGLLQRETSMLLNSRKFMNTVHRVLFSAGGSLAALNGVNVLNRLSIEPFAISGLLTTSPLLVKEVQNNTDIPVLLKEELGSASVLDFLGEKKNVHLIV